MKRILTGMGLLLCLSFLVQAQTWDPVKRLTYTTGDSYDSAIATHGAYVHVVWIEYDLGTYYRDIYYKRSTDFGATWSAPMRLTWGVYADSLAIAVNATAVHVVYLQSGDIIYRKSVDNGATWSRTRITWGASAYYGGLNMAVSGNFIHVVFISHSGASTYLNLSYKRSTDNGVTWSAPTKLGDGSSGSLVPAIAVSGANVHVVYWNDVLHWGHLDMYYRRSTDNGATWNAPLQLASLEKAQLREDTDSPSQAWNPSVTVSGADVHVFYLSQAGYFESRELFLMSSTDNGMTWGSGKRLTWNGYCSGLSPKGSAADGDNVYVTYAYYPSGIYYYDVYFKKSTDRGITWSAPTRLTYLGNAYNGPSMIYSPGTGYFHLVFDYAVDYTYYYKEIYYKRGI
jgi:hypothetical protein